MKCYQCVHVDNATESGHSTFVSGTCNRIRSISINYKINNVAFRVHVIERIMAMNFQPKLHW